MQSMPILTSMLNNASVPTLSVLSVYFTYLCVIAWKSQGYCFIKSQFYHSVSLLLWYNSVNAVLLSALTRSCKTSSCNSFKASSIFFLLKFIFMCVFLSLEKKQLRWRYFKNKLKYFSSMALFWIGVEIIKKWKSGFLPCLSEHVHNGLLQW